MAVPYFQNNFRGGLSNNDFLWPVGSFRDAKNVDVRTNPRGVQLATAKTDLATMSTLGADVTKIFRAGNTLYAITMNGNVRGATDGANYYTVPTAESYLNATVFKMADGFDYLYLFKSGGRIDRVKIGSDGIISWGGIEVNWAEFTSDVQGTVLRMDVVQANDAQFYFSWGRSVYYIDKGTAGGTIYPTNRILQVRADEKIVGMTYYGDFFKIYTNVGRVYQWDGVDSVPYYAFSFRGTFFRYVANAGKYDYVVAGGESPNSQLYVAGGYDLNLINRTYETAVDAKFAYSLGSSTTPAFFCNGVLYLADSYGVYAMGEYVPGIKSGINRETIFSDAGNAKITAFYAEGTTLYVGYTLDGVSKTATITLAVSRTYASSGQVESLILTADKIWKRKRIEEIEVAYELPTVGGSNASIDFYVQVDKGGWTLIGTASDKTQFYKRFPIAQIVKNGWNLLQWKAVLNRNATASSLTPKLYEVNILYSDIVGWIEK